MNKVLALTGHRFLPPDFHKEALLCALEEKIQDGFDYFLCGMAVGYDLLCAELLIYLKQKYKIKIEACIPFLGQEARYSPEDKKRYAAALEWCDKKTVLTDSPHRSSYLIRDRYMVENADGVLAYCKRTTGGTAYTVREAEKRGLPVHFLD